MWEAIQYISSDLTLLAFIVAVASWTYKRSPERALRLIETAEEGNRATLVRSALEVLDIDTARLTNRQLCQLAIELIRARVERFRITAIVVCVLALILAAVSVVAVRGTVGLSTRAPTLSAPIDH